MVRVMLIDDDDATRGTIEHALAAAGYDVQAYEDASLAWDAIRHGPPLDLLITEIAFSTGRPHGLALAHSAKLHHPGASIIFITADPAIAGVTRGERKSASLMKPFEMATLLSAVRDAIGNTGTPAQVPSSPSEPRVP